MTDIASLGIRVTTEGVTQAATQLDRLENSSERTSKTVSKLGGIWKAAIGAISVAAIIQTTRALVRQADEWNTINARIGLVTKSSAQLLDVQSKLFGIAQRTGGSFSGTADLYVKLAQSSERLRDNQAELLQVTELVNKSLVVSGASAASAEAVTRQFAQALAAGALRGDEFVSVMEGAPRLAQAIAQGLDVSVGKLRELASEGKLTADTVTSALLRSGKSIDQEFGRLPLTVGRAVQMVENAILRLVGKTDEASNSSRALARAIAQVADTLSDPATIQGFQTTIALLADMTSKAVEAASKFIALAEAARIASDSGRASTASDAALRERLNQLNEAIEVGREWRKEEGNIIERLAGGRDFRAYDAMVAEAARIQQILETRANGSKSPGNGRGRGIQVDIRSNTPPVSLGSGSSSGSGSRRTGTDFGASLLQQIRQQTALNEEQAQSENRLTESQRLRVRVLEQLEALGGKVSASARAEIQAELERLKVTDDAVKKVKEQIQIEASLSRLRQQIADAEAAQQRSNAIDLMSIGRGGDAVERQRRELELEYQYQDELRELYRQAATERRAVSQQEEDELRASYDKRIKWDRDYWDERARLQADWRNGAVRALEDYMAEANDVASRTADAIDGVLNSLQGTFEEFFRTGKLDWKGFLDDINAELARFFSQQLVKQLLSSFGGGQQGAASGGGQGQGIDWAGIIGSFFGGGRASGGPVRAGKLYEVGEKGAELFQSGGRNFFIPPRDGYVQPNSAMQSAGGDLYQNITVVGAVSKKSADQLAVASMRRQNIARRRTG